MGEDFGVGLGWESYTPPRWKYAAPYLTSRILGYSGEAPMALWNLCVHEPLPKVCVMGSSTALILLCQTPQFTEPATVPTICLPLA